MESKNDKFLKEIIDFSKTELSDLILDDIKLGDFMNDLNINKKESKNTLKLKEKKKKGFDLTKGLRDIDNFNKNIITGKVISQRTVNGKMVLPKISLRNNEINFNKTMITLNKERTKKTIWEDYLRKKQNDIKTKKFKKVNPVKAQ